MYSLFRRRLIFLFLITPLSIFILFSCKQEDSSTLDDNATDEQKIEEIKPSERTNVKFEVQEFKDNPKEYYNGKKELRIGAEPLSKNFFEGEKIYFDPHRSLTNTELQLADVLFPKLVTLSPNGVPIPMLAKSWKINKLNNGFTYIFYLGDYTWGDGTPVTATQVAASYIRAISPLVKNPNATELALAIRGGASFYAIGRNFPPGYIAGLEKRVQINVLDEKTLYITTSSLAVNLLTALANPIAVVLPINTASADSNSTKNIFDLSPDTWIRKGLYIPTLASKNKISLQISQDYDIRPWIDNIEFIFEQSIATRIGMFRNNKVDWVILPYAFTLTDIIEFENNEASQNIFDNLHSIKNTAEIFLEVPDQSALRYVFFKNSDINAVSQNFSQLNYINLLSEEEQINMKNILSTFGQEVKRYLFNYNISHKRNTSNSLFCAENIFFPSTPLPPSNIIYTQELPKENTAEQETINELLPDELLYNSETQNNPEDDSRSQSVTTEQQKTSNLANAPQNITAYIQSIITFLKDYRNGNQVIRIAYNDRILENYAKSIGEYFSSYQVTTEIIPILSNDHPHGDKKYDIAIRISQANSPTRIGIYSKLWWVWAARDTEPQNLFGEFYKLNDILYFVDNINQYLDIFNDINREAIDYARYVPLWYISRYELINTTLYPWWKAQMSYHPLFSQLKE